LRGFRPAAFPVVQRSILLAVFCGRAGLGLEFSTCTCQTVTIDSSLNKAVVSDRKSYVAHEKTRRFVGTTVLCGVIVCLASCTPEAVDRYNEVGREPNMSPDYSAVTMPPNIAPLNFRVQEEGLAYSLTVRGESGSPITVFSRTGQMRIPQRRWRALLDANRGRSVSFDVCVQDADRQWKRFQPVTNSVAREDIDGTLVFRFMKPLYNWWKDIGIYQRDLSGFDTSVVLQGQSFGQGCMNCHSFVANDPETMTISLRSATYGSDTLLARKGRIDKIGAKWGYTAWHPSGRLAV
jgi:hypothetical protein